MSVSPFDRAGESIPAAQRLAAQRFWTRYFTVYDTLNQARPYQAMLARQLELLAPAPGDRALDAGTGSGNFATALVSAGVQVTGIDFCEPAFELARAKAPSATFEFGDLTLPLRYESNTFDLVACSAVLHVMSRGEQVFALGEMARVLRPGGRLIVTAFAHGFSATRVYLETLAAERRASGLVTATTLGLRYSFNTARILFYVRQIQRLHRRGSYAYVDESSLRTLLSNRGLEPRVVERTLAGQCVTSLAVKRGR
jgi:ubiquinone/menaquinone biosynthesis C-methylase UbiE